MSGTSFSTPKTAGTFSSAVLQVRQAFGHAGGITDGALAIAPDGKRITNADVREAFNRTAVYFDFNDCQRGGNTQAPVNPAAPWAQMGWGHIGNDSIAPAVNHLLGVKPAAEKDVGAQTFQAAVHEWRRIVWENQE